MSDVCISIIYLGVIIILSIIFGGIKNHSVKKWFRNFL